MTQKFKTDLTSLVKTLQASSRHYIRCITPNSTKSSALFTEEKVLHQLRCTGIMETIKLRKAGFANRMSPAFSFSFSFAFSFSFLFLSFSFSFIHVPSFFRSSFLFLFFSFFVCFFSFFSQFFVFFFHFLSLSISRLSPFFPLICLKVCPLKHGKMFHSLSLILSISFLFSFFVFILSVCLKVYLLKHVKVFHSLSFSFFFLYLSSQFFLSFFLFVLGSNLSEGMPFETWANVFDLLFKDYVCRENIEEYLVSVC